MITEIVDIKGEALNIGDKVAWGDTTSSYNAVIGYGEIVDIKFKNTQTHIIVKIIKDCNPYYNGSLKKFIYPRNHHNLIKIK